MFEVVSGYQILLYTERIGMSYRSHSFCIQNYLVIIMSLTLINLFYKKGHDKLYFKHALSEYLFIITFRVSMYNFFAEKICHL